MTAAEQRALALRQRAEAQLPENTTQSFEALQQALQELRVHQIELELQNEELRSTQAELDTAHARYFDFYDLAPVGYITVNEEGRVQQANLTTAKLLRLARRTLIHQPITQLIFAKDQDRYYLLRKDALRTLEPQSCDLRLVRADDTLFWANLLVIAVACDDGAPVLRMVLTDASLRKAAEVAQRIAAIAFESQEGIFVTDAGGTILQVNQAFTAITGYPAAEAVGQNPKMLNSGRHDAAFFADMWASISRDGAWQGEIWNRRKGGEVFPEWLNFTAVKDDAGHVTHYVASFSDITERKAAQDRIQSLAFYDPLTSLPNRRLLMDRLSQAIAAGARHLRKGALLFVDLDDFKTINDTLGHHLGDLLLEQVAQRLSTCIREGDTAARLGGDEFVVMLADLSETALDAAAQAEVVGEKILAMLAQPYQLGLQQCRSTASIGVTLFGGNQHEAIDEPLKRADLAMYQAKAAGRNTLRFFDPQMQAVVSARAVLETDLRTALEQQHFLLYYQPQVAADGSLIGAEALVRWLHPARGLVSPADFIPLAEDTGLILPLGQWVLETACAQLEVWAKKPENAHWTLAVNVSARQFRQPLFVEQVLATLEHTGANPQRLKLELTESLLVDNVDEVITKMRALKEIGVGFSLDDFGTGYSSLSYLKRLPLDQLKIDQSFVRDLLSDPDDAVIARAIVALGHSLGMQVIAEGVETAAQREMLAELGCDAYQGYHFGRPAPASDLEAFQAK